MIIYTIGFGSLQGEPIPHYGPDGSVVGFKTDQNGETVLSRLDESTLQEIASIGRGSYFHATADGSELVALTSELDDLQTAQLESRFETTKIERFPLYYARDVAAPTISELIPTSKQPTSYNTWIKKSRFLSASPKMNQDTSS